MTEPPTSLHRPVYEFINRSVGYTAFFTRAIHGLLLLLVGIVLRESESAPPANQRTSWPSYGQVEVVDGEFQTFSSPSDIVVVVPSRGVPKVRVLSPLTRWK